MTQETREDLGVDTALSIRGAEIVPAGPIDDRLPLITKEQVAQIKEQVGLHREMKVALMACTNPEDWQDMGGVAYPKDGAIHAIAFSIGLHYGEPEIERREWKDDKGPVVEFVCKLKAHWRGRVYSEIGSAWTRDPFFARAHKEDIPFEEIDQGDVRKKAVTNAQHRILVKAIGLGSIPWAELQGVGIDRQRAGMTRYKGSEGRMASGRGGWTPTKEELWGKLVDLCDGDEKAASAELVRKTENKEKNWRGYSDPQKLPDRSAEWLLPRIRKAWAERFEGPGEEPAQAREPGEEG